MTTLIDQHMGPTILLLQDGDRRWAKREGVSFAEGYDVMAQKIAMIIDHLAGKGITKLYVRANSPENLNRPADQVNGFFSAYLKIPDYCQSKLKVVLKGDLDKLPDSFKPLYRKLQADTATNSEFALHLLLNWTVVDEVARIAGQLASAGKPITNESLLATSDIPEPVDLIIRTGKRHRLSNFVPLSARYAEITFLDILFPDITASDIDDVLRQYAEKDAGYGQPAYR